MERIPKKNPDIIWNNVRGETVLLNSTSGRYYGLNKVGCAFWEKIDGKRSLAEIVELMLEQFNVEKEILVKDIKDLTKNLTENNLVTLD
ncbi:MAG: PqqD family protein [Desulfobacterales bacterium]|nr:PqqD family protein [Desulfobacterales bacterium]